MNEFEKGRQQAIKEVLELIDKLEIHKGEGGMEDKWKLISFDLLRKKIKEGIKSGE
jgi:hypothetical protein